MIIIKIKARAGERFAKNEMENRETRGSRKDRKSEEEEKQGKKENRGEARARRRKGMLRKKSG